MKVLSGLSIPSFAGNKSLISNGSDYITEGGATAAELSQLSGVTSNIQTQLNSKVDKSVSRWQNGTYVSTANDALTMAQRHASGVGAVVGRFYNLAEAPRSGYFNFIMLPETAGGNTHNTIALPNTGAIEAYIGRGTNSGTETWVRLWGGNDFTSTDLSHWNTAYGWGNHTSAGYLTASALAGVNYGTTFETPGTDPFSSRGSYNGQGGVRTWNGTGPFGALWYNVVDCRHRNAWNPPTDVWGGELAWGMTGSTDRLAFRSRNGAGTPGSWSEVAVLGKDVTFSTIGLTSNGAGNNIRVGDDVYLGDVSLANTLGLRGQGTGGNQGFIKFGDGYLFGFNGSNLVYNNNRILTTADGVITGSGSNLQIPIFNGGSSIFSDSGFRVDFSGGNVTTLHLGSDANPQTDFNIYGNFASVINLSTGGVARWGLGSTSDKFSIVARDSSGNVIDYPIEISNASSGYVRVNRILHSNEVLANSYYGTTMHISNILASGTIKGDILNERVTYLNGTTNGATGVVIDVNGAGGASLPTGGETGTMLVYAGQMNIQTDTITIPSGEALWYRSQAGGSSRVVGPSSISVNRQCITVIKFANEWRVNGLLYV